MKKARLRITAVCDGQRTTVVLEFPTIQMCSRALTQALPLFLTNGGKTQQKANSEQLVLIPHLQDAGRAAR